MIIPISVKVFLFKTTLEDLEVEASYLWIFVAIIVSGIISLAVSYGLVMVLGLLGLFIGKSSILIAAIFLGSGLGMYIYFYMLGWLLRTNECVVIVADIVSNIYALVTLGAVLLIISMFSSTTPTGYEINFIDTLYQKFLF
ncbi:hypothetical protein Mefer_0338 [Methanocaldococcus fervens AG86]|uniref:Uncharacterized protein n=2 Tax=Methanocaldococcus TaxID=196118 RepID=C7P6J2_METFA|nr:hypothetical protein Mefer_0338 [Methanocaldococcus fervens AG86]